MNINARTARLMITIIDRRLCEMAIMRNWSRYINDTYDSKLLSQDTTGELPCTADLNILTVHSICYDGH